MIEQTFYLEVYKPRDEMSSVLVTTHFQAFRSRLTFSGATARGEMDVENAVTEG